LPWSAFVHKKVQLVPIWNGLVCYVSVQRKVQLQNDLPLDAYNCPHAMMQELQLQKLFSKNVPRSSVKPKQNWLTAVLSVLFSAKDKRRGKIGVSNGMKLRTQILDKTQKKE